MSWCFRAFRLQLCVCVCESVTSVLLVHNLYANGRLVGQKDASNACWNAAHKEYEKVPVQFSKDVVCHVWWADIFQSSGSRMSPMCLICSMSLLPPPPSVFPFWIGMCVFLKDIARNEHTSEAIISAKYLLHLNNTAETLVFKLACHIQNCIGGHRLCTTHIPIAFTTFTCCVHSCTMKTKAIENDRIRPD